MNANVPVETEASIVDGSFEQFMDALRDVDEGATVLSARRFSDALRMELQTLADQAKVHRNTVARAPGSKGVQDYLRQALRVIKAATDLNGELRKALFWYRNDPIAVFDYKTAETLVADGRADDVVRYIETLEAGFAG